MQASTPVFPFSLSTTDAFAVLTGLILMSTSVPDAGLVPQTEIIPLADSRSDLTLNEISALLEKRLPAAHRRDSAKLARLVLDLSDRHQFSPTFLLSVMETESSFRTDVVSKSGAVGLMQLLPATASEVAEKYKISGYRSEQDLLDPATNLKLGVAYLASLRRQFGHSLHYVAAYNLGPTALRRRLQSGQFELGAIDRYVRTIHERSRALRGSRPAAQRRATLLSASL